MPISLPFAMLFLVASSGLFAESVHRDPVLIPVELTNALLHEGVVEARSKVEQVVQQTLAQQQQTKKLLSQTDFLKKNNSTPVKRSAKSVLRDLKKLREKILYLEAAVNETQSLVADYRSEKDGESSSRIIDSEINEHLSDKLSGLREILYELEQADISISKAQQSLADNAGRGERKSKKSYMLHKQILDVQPNWIKINDDNLEKTKGNKGIVPEQVDLPQSIQQEPTKPAVINPNITPEDKIKVNKVSGPFQQFGLRVLWAVVNTIIPSATASPAPLSAGTDNCYTDVADVNGYRNADLALNVSEVGDHPEFHALAQQLNYSPIKIFEYVSNKLDYDNYRGSVLGARAALKSDKANDIDHASLMIALLRASNIPARYASGVILLENKQEHYYWHRTLSYLGMNSSNSMNGHNYDVPDGNSVIRNGRSHRRATHVWVEACVPYSNYRGNGLDNVGHRWVPLDASYKQYTPKQGLDLQIPFDQLAYLSTRSKKLPLEIYTDNLLTEARLTNPDISLSEIGTTWEKTELKLHFLPDSLPYYVQEYRDWSGGPASLLSAMPNGWIKKARISFGGLPIDAAYSLFSNGRVTLSFEDHPLTEADRAQYFDAVRAISRHPAGYPYDPEVLSASLDNTFLEDFRNTGQGVCSGPSSAKPLLKIDGADSGLVFSSLPICIPYATTCTSREYCTNNQPVIGNLCASGPPECLPALDESPWGWLEHYGDIHRYIAAIESGEIFGVECSIKTKPRECWYEGVPNPWTLQVRQERRCTPARTYKSCNQFCRVQLESCSDVVTGYNCTATAWENSCASTWAPSYNNYSLTVTPMLNGVAVGATTTYNDKISPLEYYALQINTPNQSDEFLKERFDQLNTNITAVADPWQDADGTIGEYLHIVGRKYVKYLQQGNALIGQLYNETGSTQDMVVMTSLKGSAEFVYDMPYAVFSNAYLVDAFAYSQSTSLEGGSGDADAFNLSGLNSSAYETYIWQENAHTDAISTVTGLQVAQEKGIVVSTLSSARALQNFVDVCVADPQPNQQPDCYKQAMVDQIKAWFTEAANQTVTLPQKPINVPGFTGYIYLGDSPTKKQYAINRYNGGYSTWANNNAWFDMGSYYSGSSLAYNPADWNLTSNPNLFSTGWYTDISSVTNTWNAQTTTTSIENFPALDYGIETFTTNSIWSDINSTIGNGYNSLISWAGDPVNMVTGNMYHEETDFTIPARGLPLLFKRYYNSRSVSINGPLGRGWSHSYNQSLKFVASSGNTPTEIIWFTSDGGKKFIKLDSSIAYVGGVLDLTSSKVVIPDGFYFTLSRPHSSGAASAFVIREKSGITYHFEAVSGAVGDQAKLIAIIDQHGNQINLNYQDGSLQTVIDPDGRQLAFTYDDAGRIRDITLDWSGEVYSYNYANGRSLTSVQSPLDIDRNVNGSTYTYYTGQEGPNLQDRMQTFSYANGNSMTFEYYVNGRVYRHFNNKGETQYFSYNDFRRESVSTDENGKKQQFFFNMYGLPLEIVDATGAKQAYRYEETFDPMLRTVSSNAMGHETQTDYDTDGNILSQTLPSGATEQNSYFNAHGRPQLIKNSNGDYRLNLFDATGNLVDDIVFVKGYGASIDPTTLTAGSFDPTPYAANILSWTFNSYDSFGNLIRSRLVEDFNNRESGPYIVYNYDDGLNQLTGVQPTSISYNGDIDGDGVISAGEGLGSYSFSYDAMGRLIQGYDKNLYPVSYQYDSAGNLIKGTDANGKLRDYTYDDSGLLLNESLSLVDGGALRVIDSTAYIYDSVNRLTQQMDPAGAVSSFEYDAAGNILKTTSPDGYVLRYEYDSAKRLVAAFDEEGHTVRRRLDSLGRVKTLIDANGFETTHSYYGAEQNGRLQRVTDPEGRWTEFDYDDAGQVISTVAGQGASSVSEVLTSYDALGRVKRVVKSSYVDTQLGAVRPVTTFSYNTLGHKTAVYAGYTATASGAVGADVLSLQASYSYDHFGRLLTETDALGKVWQVPSYDVHGNTLISQDPNGNVTTATYGYGGVVLTQSTTGPNGSQAVSYSRNHLGQPLQIVSNDVTLSYRYNRAHRVASVTDSRASKTIAYNYSMGGLLNKICETSNDLVCDNSDVTTAYLYDPVGRLTAVRGPDNKMVNYSYDDGGRLAQKAFPNMVEEAYQYYDDNRIKSINIRDRLQHNSAVSIYYTYDAAGRTQTTTQDYFQGLIANNASYTYDGMGRLSNVTANWHTESVSYDPYGNRRLHSYSNNYGSISKAYKSNAAHQLTEVYQDSLNGPLLSQFAYDDNGNQVTETSGGQTLAFQYDSWNRLRSSTFPDTSTETYQYDHSRRRIAKTTAGATSQYLMSGPDIISQYSQDWSTVQAQFSHGPRMDEPLMRLAGGTTDYYHADAFGSIATVTGPVAAGSIPVNAINFYTAWGQAELNSTVSLPYTYAGREPDASGLMYMRNRYYAPRYGRFTQSDPLGFVNGVNRYAYVMNSPVNYVDPWGTFASEVTDTSNNVGEYVNQNFDNIVNNISDTRVGLGMFAAGTALLKNADRYMGHSAELSNTLSRISHINDIHEGWFSSVDGFKSTANSYTRTSNILGQLGYATSGFVYLYHMNVGNYGEAKLAGFDMLMGAAATKVPIISGVYFAGRVAIEHSPTPTPIYMEYINSRGPLD